MELAEISILEHYQASYFNNFQKGIGEFGGRANKFMFEDHIEPHHAVLDFGCGGGFLLDNLTCRQKIGIEINPAAREFCNRITGIRCFESLESVTDRSIDIIISSHCLEHTTNPYEIVAMLYRKLKDGGKIIIVVPLESYHHKWKKNDLNNHLYSFSPMNLGNILQGNGFIDIRTEPVPHRWIPLYHFVAKTFGLWFFHKLSWAYGMIMKNHFVQIKGVGVKKVS